MDILDELFNSKGFAEWLYKHHSSTWVNWEINAGSVKGYDSTKPTIQEILEVAQEVTPYTYNSLLSAFYSRFACE